MRRKLIHSEVRRKIMTWIQNPVTCNFATYRVDAKGVVHKETGPWAAQTEATLGYDIQDYPSNPEEFSTFTFMCGPELIDGSLGASEESGQLDRLFSDMPIFDWNVTEASHLLLVDNICFALGIGPDDIRPDDIELAYAVLYSRLKRSGVNVENMWKPEIDISVFQDDNLFNPSNLPEKTTPLRSQEFI